MTTVDGVPMKKKQRCSEDDEEREKEGIEKTEPAATSFVETDARGVQESREVIEARRYEYLDHPADIQLHSWGATMEEAVEALMVSMYGYMTELGRVDEVYEYYFSGSGRDVDTMLFSFMEEALCSFQSEPFFVAKRFKVIKLDLDNFSIEGVGYGESYDLENKHNQEADIKAITYSNMQIIRKENRTDLYVIVDI